MQLKQAVTLIIVYLIDNVICQSSLYSIPEYSIREPSYIIVAPRVVRPAEKVRISCTIMNKHWANLMVKALIFTDEQEIVSGIQEFLPNVPNTIAMTMPNNIRSANYYLRVEGKLPTGETTFSDQKTIIFEQKAVSIIVQLERPDYRHESILRFRCIPMYPDLSAYLGTMDVFIIAPSGIIIKRWENVQTNAGVVSLSYIFNDAPPPGLHTVKCAVMGYEATRTFEIYEFYQWKYEVNVSMPHYFLTTSPGISGVVVAK